MRRNIGARERIKIFRDNFGLCHLCGGKIDVGQKWDLEHVIPLALGGADEGDNLRPAHAVCHAAKTHKGDVPAIARAKRREAKHLGAAVSRNPLPFGRKSGLRKKINGQVVRRV